MNIFMKIFLRMRLSISLKILFLTLNEYHCLDQHVKWNMQFFTDILQKRKSCSGHFRKISRKIIVTESFFNKADFDFN